MARIEIIEKILEKIPRPNYSEIPLLYEDLDNMARRIGEILINSKIFDPKNLLVEFDKADENEISNLIEKDPKVMIPFFTMICGFSIRELERLHGIKNVYSIYSDLNEINRLAEVFKEQLRRPLHLETVIYKFYKNWEEHQKRHYRGREAENYVIEVLRQHGYNAGKIKVKCKGKEREIDCAIPPDPNNLKVVIMIRGGVYRDIVKRAKEFSAEYDEMLSCYPNVKFVVVYFVSQHERERINEIRAKIEGERGSKKPYDLIILTTEELSTTLLKKLEDWKIPRN